MYPLYKNMRNHLHYLSRKVLFIRHVGFLNVYSIYINDAELFLRSHITILITKYINVLASKINIK